MSVARLQPHPPSSGRAEALYSPAMLTLAASLGAYPINSAHPLRAQSRSRTCGSVIDLSLDLVEDRRICAVGLRVSACAVGQAAAAVFARGAQGCTPDAIAKARAVLAAWLAGGGERLDWAGADALAPALPFTGRHPAILLPWDAALMALDSGRMVVDERETR